MTYQEHIYLTEDKTIKIVEKIIKEERLDTRNKSENYVMKRHYLMHFIRENTSLSLAEIGRLFNKHHSSVIWGLENHKTMTQVKDKKYKFYTEHVKGYLNKVTGKDAVTVLRDKIRSADTLIEFYSIREKVKNKQL